MFPKWIQTSARWPPTGLGLADLGSKGVLVGPGGTGGQDEVQEPGEYFGLDPWGSVQEAARPLTSGSHSQRRLRQLPLLTRAEFHRCSVAHCAGPAQASGRPRYAHGSAVSQLLEPGHPTEAARAGGQRRGIWSPWDPRSSVTCPLLAV